MTKIKLPSYLENLDETEVESAHYMLKAYQTYLFMARQNGLLRPQYLKEAEVIYRTLRLIGIPLRAQHRELV